MKKILFIGAALLLLAVPLLMAQGNMGKSNMPGKCDMQGKQMMMGQHGGRGHGQGMGIGMGMGLMQCKALNLTDDQRGKMEQLTFDHQSRMIDLRAQVEKARLEKRHAMMADNPDKTRVLSAARELNRIQGQIAEERINHRFAVRDILTAEQLETLKSLGGRGMGPDGDRGPGRGNRFDCPRQPGQGPGPRGFAPDDDSNSDEG